MCDRSKKSFDSVAHDANLDCDLVCDAIKQCTGGTGKVSAVMNIAILLFYLCHMLAMYCGLLRDRQGTCHLGQAWHYK